MTKIILKEKWIGILMGVLLSLTGIVVVILGIITPSSLTLALSIILAVSLFLGGGFFLINGLSQKENYDVFDFTYVIAGLSIALGVILLVNTSLISEILIYIVSVSVLTFGASLLIRSIILLIRKVKIEKCIIGIVLGAILIILGVLALIFKSQLTQVIYISSGVLLTSFGIMGIVYSTRK